MVRQLILYSYCFEKVLDRIIFLWHISAYPKKGAEAMMMGRPGTPVSDNQPSPLGSCSAVAIGGAHLRGTAISPGAFATGRSPRRHRAGAAALGGVPAISASAFATTRSPRRCQAGGGGARWSSRHFRKHIRDKENCPSDLPPHASIVSPPRAGGRRPSESCADAAEDVARRHFWYFW
jgi:hypothetical protein